MIFFLNANITKLLLQYFSTHKYLLINSIKEEENKKKVAALFGTHTKANREEILRCNLKFEFSILIDR